MKSRTIELRSGVWEWTVVDPDDPRTRGRARSMRTRAPSAVGGPEPARSGVASETGPAGAPPLPRRRIELRSQTDERHRMSVRVPAHLGNAGDDAAIKMLALNPDRRIVVDPDGTTWYVWPDIQEQGAPAPPPLSLSRCVRAVQDGGRPRKLALPEGLALGQLTDREILDLLA